MTVYLTFLAFKIKYIYTNENPIHSFIKCTLSIAPTIGNALKIFLNLCYLEYIDILKKQKLRKNEYKGWKFQTFKEKKDGIKTFFAYF